MAANMRKMPRAVAVTIFVVSVLVGCTNIPGENPGMVRGSGNVITESRQVSGFNEVVFTMSGDLTIVQNGTEALTIQAEDNIVPLIRTEVKGNRLTIGTRENSSFSNSKPVSFKVSVKDVSYICATGSGGITMDQVKTGQLKAETSGSGDVSVHNVSANSYTAQSSGSGGVTSSGTVDTLNVTATGSGSYDGKDLASAHARVELTGSGDATVRVSDTLYASVSGSGSVSYIGDPTVDKNDSGSGEIVRLGSR